MKNILLEIRRHINRESEIPMNTNTELEFIRMGTVRKHKHEKYEGTLMTEGGQDLGF